MSTDLHYAIRLYPRVYWMHAIVTINNVAHYASGMI